MFYSWKAGSLLSLLLLLLTLSGFHQSWRKSSGSSGWLGGVGTDLGMRGSLERCGGINGIKNGVNDWGGGGDSSELWGSTNWSKGL